jgi:PAS domain S-box-containing protein
MTTAYRLHKADGSLYPIEELPVFQALRFGRSTMRDDVVVHRPDGRRVSLVTWAAPVTLDPRRGVGPGEAQGAKDQPDAAVWVLEDLTALRQAEAARRDSERRLRAVIETMGEGLIVLDRGGGVIDCNPAACAVLLQSAEQLRGRTLFDLGWTWLRDTGAPLPPDDHPARTVLRLAKPVRNIMLGIVSQSSAQASTRRWLLLNAMPLGPGTPAAGAVVSFSDITAYRQAQEGVQRSEEKIRGLMESLPLLVLQTDAELKLIDANPAARQALTLNKAAGADFWKTFLAADNWQAFAAQLEEARTGRARRSEVGYVTRDGSKRVAYALTQPAPGTAEIPALPSETHRGVTILLVDVTRERLLEQDLARAQRLEVVGRLSSGIAHDFNNLLAVIVGLADLVRIQLGGNHPAQKDVQGISHAAKEAANLAGQLLAFSRKRRANLHRVEVNKVVRQTLEMLRPTLPAPIQLDAPEPDAVLATQADETQLQQVLMNLCLNARDAVQGRGDGASVIRIRIEQASSWIRLSVEDNGAGMTESVKARIFDPFFSTKEHGTGLGLAVVQQIVESYGGRIEVESQLGAGSRFEVWLPSAAGESA